MKASNSHKPFSGPGRSKLLGAVLLTLCFLALLSVRLYVAHPATGDEPHYLLMDYSLVHDGDFNLKNNYQHQDYRSFYPAPLPAQNQVDKQQFDHNSDKFYSIHGIGIPLLILPGYLIGEHTGVAIEMTLIAVAVVWLTWLWAFKLTKDKNLSIVSAGLLASCMFFNGLAGYIYPDLIIAGLTLTSLLITVFYYDKKRYQFLFGLILGTLVFIHFKTLALAAPLFFLMVYQLWSKKRQLPWSALLSILPMSAYFLLSLHAWYGVWDPRQIYPADATLTASPLRTIPAMLFDANRGALVYNPILLLVFVGIVPWFKQRKKALVISVLATVPSIFLLTTFQLWNGGYAPTGRYIIDFLPVFIPAITFTLILLRARWQQVVVGLLVVATLFITIATTLLKPSYMDPQAYRLRSTFFAGVEKHIGIGFDHLLPSYSRYTTLDDRHGNLKVFLGMLTILSLTGYGYYLGKSLKPAKG